MFSSNFSKSFIHETENTYFFNCQNYIRRDELGEFVLLKLGKNGELKIEIHGNQKWISYLF